MDHDGEVLEVFATKRRDRRAALKVIGILGRCRELARWLAMTFKSAIDQPKRFQHSKAVGAHFGLTQRKYQSGEVDRTGRISKVGDAAVRVALYEAANTLLTRAAL